MYINTDIYTDNTLLLLLTPFSGNYLLFSGDYRLSFFNGKFRSLTDHWSIIVQHRTSQSCRLVGMEVLRWRRTSLPESLKALFRG
ncbi:hypothetical protein HanIR_Chr13g0666731 [Helianthus annuus]|nr:hypothetical protein HanIR_Chr13g0666731 [Helianthus annuus]